jgi:hypothetical protein
MQAGLIIGAVFFLLNRGIPWVGSGEINPAVMGREINSGAEQTFGSFAGLIAIHFLVAIIYSLILAPIVHGFRPWMAGLVGAVGGLVLYFINYAVATMILDPALMRSEWQCAVQHVIFGLVFAETYKGMVRRRPETIVV